MSRPRGLSTKWARLTVLRVLAAAVWVLLAVLFLVVWWVPATRDPLLPHDLLVLLISLAVYGWLIWPFAAALVVALVTGVLVFSGWALGHFAWAGWDMGAFGVLMGAALVQHHRMRRRLQQLTQQLNDLDESLYVKEQAFELAHQTRDGLQYKLHRYQQLHTIAEQLSRLVKLDAITQLTVDRTFELIGKSDVCLLFLVDRQRQGLGLQASKKTAHVPVIRAKQGDQFDHYVLRTQRPLLVNDVRRDFRFSVLGVSDRPIGSVIACPVLIGENAEGVLRLDSPTPGAYNQDDLRFLDILLDLVDTAVANARLFAQTQQLALTDGLTELYRRQPFLDQLTREMARATRAKEPFAVLMLDIDDFKPYNDTFGHTAGDLVLKTVAGIVRETVPEDGMCARYGGEEFVMLLPKASRKQGVEIANRIRHTVEQRVRTAANGTGRAVTVSLGVAVFPDDAQSELGLIRRSDERLYQAKQAGKNRVWSS